MGLGGATDLLWDNASALLLSVGLFVLEPLLARLRAFGHGKDTARYYALHLVVNGTAHREGRADCKLTKSAKNAAFVVFTHSNDVVFAVWDPLAAVRAHTNLNGTIAIAALHALHWARFSLSADERLHHAVMIAVMLPLACGLNAGSLLGHGAFWTSGLPGGVDYALLVLVKLGRMRATTEKRWNAVLQTWLRAPGCVVHVLLTWLTWRYAGDALVARAWLPASLVPIAVAVVMASVFWNGQYYQARVVANQAAKAAKREREE